MKTFIDRAREFGGRNNRQRMYDAASTAISSGVARGVAVTQVRSHSLNSTAKMIIGRRGISRASVARARAVTIPKSVRATGMTRSYLSKLDNGHVRPVNRFAKGKNWASNQRWEIARLNRATGAGRKPRGYWQQNARLLRNHHMKTLAAGSARAALKGVWLGAAIEAPIAAAEEFIAFRRGQKSKTQAASDGSKKVGVAAVGGGIGGAVAFGVCAAGGSAVLVTASPVLGAVAAVHYGKRLMNLRTNKLPKEEQSKGD